MLPSASSPVKVRLNALRIARQVFSPGLTSNAGDGFFSLMPDGRVLVRPATREKINRLNLAREVFRLSIRIKLRQRKAFIARAKARRKAGLKYGYRQRVYAKPLSDFFTDMSLVAGDAVTAQSGVYVFRGADNFPFRARDFVAISRWKGNSRARQKLRALERTMHR